MMNTKFTVISALVLLAITTPSYAQIGFGAGASGASPSASPGGMSSPRSMNRGANTQNSGALNPGASNPNTAGANAAIAPAAGGINAQVNANTQLRGFPPNANNTNFSNYASQRWDANRDSYVSLTEWNEGVNSWYGSSINSAGDYNTWDINKDGMLDRNETSRGFSNTKMFSMYDTNNDGMIDQSESSRIPR